MATPVPTHASIAERVLAAGKHCFVEKPLAQSAADAERVVDAAKEAGRVLMVGHLLEYHPGLEMLRDVADSGELGDIHYIYGNRLNLGKLRAEENALWSLGAHDVSVRAAPRRRGAGRVHGGGRVLHARGRRGRGLLLHALPVGPRRAPAPLLARSRTRSAASRWSDRRRWPRSTTWSSSASSPCTTRASTRTSPRTASTSPARATSTARASPTTSRCGSSAATSCECDPGGVDAALRRRERAARRPRARGAAALPRREPACSARLTGRRACCSGEDVALRRVVEVGGNVVIHAGTVDRRAGPGSRTAP